MKKLKIFFVVFFCIMFSMSFGQIDVKEKLKNESVNRAEKSVDEKIDKTFDKLEKGIGSIFKKKAKSENDNEISERPAENDTSVASNDLIQENNQKLISYTQYDFVPGDRVLYFEDFSQDAVGDFPAHWTTNGSGEINTVNISPGNWLHLTTQDAVYCYTKQIELPSNFIMEFDVIPDEEFNYGYDLTLYEEREFRELNDDLYPGIKGVHIMFDPYGWKIKGYSNEEGEDRMLEGNSENNPVIKEEFNHIIVWIQNRRLRIYHSGAKVVDMPTNIYADTKFNKFLFSGWSTECKPYISNLKITTAASDTRSKLITEGKLISYGINFDVNSDKIKPESYGALNDIAKVLKEVADLELKIVGHTDSDGDEASNLNLSQRRAVSVKNALCSDFGITANRIQTDGMGENMPIEPNITVEQKSMNRRVEFLKL